MESFKSFFLESSYRGEHLAPGKDSAPGYDLTLNGVYPKDVYDMPSWYESEEGLEVLKRVLSWRNRPDHKVPIFRAIPSSIKERKISEGDWVTISKQYAKDHGEGALNGDYVLIHKFVPVSSIFTNGDSIMEWGYYPS